MYNYSIVLPYYDKYDLFVKAVDSILDREDIQIIVVDNSKVSLVEHQIPCKQKAKITYVTSDNTKGAGCARNVGLTKVEGKYTLFCDADDYFTPEAFDSFDKYLDKEYDIVFFKPTSINLTDGNLSNRHIFYAQIVESYLKDRNEDLLRCKWEVPWAKLYRTSYILLGGFEFDEVKVGNDVWFSLVTGYNAPKITADDTIVYVVTEGEKGTSLTLNRTKENWFTRFQVAIRVNKFLKSKGKYQYHIRLLGFLKITLKEFGIKEYMRFLFYAIKNNVGIF